MITSTKDLSIGFGPSVTEEDMPTVSAGGVPVVEPSSSPVSLEPTSWSIAIVKRNSEKVCRDLLLREGIESYVATQTMMVRHSKKRPRPVEYVRLPAKVFLRQHFESPRDCTAFCMHHPYVHKLMTDPARPLTASGYPGLAVISDSELRRLRSYLDDSERELTFGYPDSSYVIGGWAKVVYGALRDQVGVIASRAGKSYFVLHIAGLDWAKVQVSPSDIIPIATPTAFR